MSQILDQAAIQSTSANFRRCLSSSTDQAVWIQLYAPAGNQDTVYFGGPTVAAGRGIPLYPGGSYAHPKSICPYNAYLFFLASGDKVHWLYHEES